MALLTLDALQLSFGGVAALAGVSLDVNPHDFFAVIGPNGAGKTSIFNCISGIYAPTRGRIAFDGKDITHLKPHQRAKLGIARTFQNIALFRGMTVLDNIKLGRHAHMRTGLLDGLLYWGRAEREEIEIRAEIEERIIAASVLASVMRELGDYKQALSLNSEVVEWNAAHDQKLQLSVSRLLQSLSASPYTYCPILCHAWTLSPWTPALSPSPCCWPSPPEFSVALLLPSPPCGPI